MAPSAATTLTTKLVTTVPARTRIENWPFTTSTPATRSVAPSDESYAFPWRDTVTSMSERAPVVSRYVPSIVVSSPNPRRIGPSATSVSVPRPAPSGSVHVSKPVMPEVPQAARITSTAIDETALPSPRGLLACMADTLYFYDRNGSSQGNVARTPVAGRLTNH